MVEPEKAGGFHYAYVIAAALCGIMGTVAALVFNAAGVFYGPVSTDLQVGRGTFALYMSILLLAATITLSFAGRIYDKYNAKIILLACVLVTAASFYIMSLATNVMVFYIVGAFMGACQAFVLYLSVPTLITRWFKKGTGTAIGICAAFSGVGAIIFNPIAGAIITNQGWRQGYLVYAIITAAIGIPCALLIVSRPEDKGLRALGDNDTTATAGSQAPVTGVSYKVAITSVVFVLALIMAFSNAFVTNINFYIPSFATDIGLALTVGATAASASQFGNMLGKVILGIVADKSLTAALSVGVGSVILGLTGLMLFGSQGVIVMSVCAFLYGVVNAVNSVLIPLVVRDAFGKKDYAKIFSNVSMALALSSTVGSSAWGFLIDATKSYAVVFTSSIALMSIVLVLGLFVMKQGRVLRAKHEVLVTQPV